MKDVFNKWNSLGFLEDIDEILARKIALVFEKLSLTLLNDKGLVFKNPYIETIAFPIFRKILVDINKRDTDYVMDDSIIFSILRKLDDEFIQSTNEDRGIAMGEDANNSLLFSNNMVGLLTK